MATTTASSSAASKTLAFFGSTGGCANAALVLALQGGYQCTALARTPSKLRDMLTTAGVSAATIDSHLVIVRGDARDVSALRATLAPVQGHDYTAATASDSKDTSDSAYPYDAARVASLVVSGIGMDPFVRKPDTTICQDWARVFVEAVGSLGLSEGHKPFIAAISTTGISAGPRDVPILFGPLYHVALKYPHMDKRLMESTLFDAQEDFTVRGTVLVRPSLLMSGPEHEVAKIRTGSEQAPAVGYMVNRKDIGRWIYDNLIAKDEVKWRGERPSVTI